MAVDRRSLRMLAAAAGAVLLGACQPPADAVAEKAAPAEIGSGFDFFVLSLSWSPSYCEAEGASANRYQCRSDRDLGLVVHGLWPQFETGWPESCDTRGNDRVPDALADSMSDIMPSRGLVGHQWRKHGSCSGLDQAAYLKATRAAFERVAIPPLFASASRASRIGAMEAEAAFRDANPELPADGIAISCADGRLDEVRICLTRDLSFRSCPQVDRRGCRQSGLSLPAAP